jgi:bisphosphoglycerate-independent phosphoglycerate mutase (AlkP superfamily)
MEEKNKIILLIIDGWGIYESYNGNAISLAKTPNFNKLVAEYPSTALKTRIKNRNSGLLTNCESGHFVLGGLYNENKSDEGLIKTLLAEEKKVFLISESEKSAQINHYLCHGDLSGENNLTSMTISSRKKETKVKNPAPVINEVIDNIIKAANSEDFDLIVGNIAEPDMAAHTGDIAVTTDIIESIDKQIKKIAKAAISRDSILLITSDHGNAEYMRGARDDQADLKHTDNPVPLILIGAGYEGRNMGWADAIGDDLSTVSPKASIADIAPTILDLLDINIPPTLIGKSLLAN